jgi:hypothetical protein
MRDFWKPLHDQVKHLAARGLQQFLVHGLLVGTEGAVGQLLDLGRQVGGHVALQPAQQEGMQLAAQAGLGLLAGVSPWAMGIS